LALQPEAGTGGAVAMFGVAPKLFSHNILPMPIRLLLRRVTAAALLLTAWQTASAAAVREGHVAVELVSEVRSIQPGQPFWVGVRFQVDPEWHINWRNAGDAGLPPTITWELPTGFSAGEIQWRLPERLVVDPS
jgi:thiol:disulfide interchange protein DsbD